MSVKQGALGSQIIRELLKAKAVVGSSFDNVKPASLDLAISDEAYEVSGIFLPKSRETVLQVLKTVVKRQHSLDKPLEVGKHYLIKLEERLRLPEIVYAFCNPKSTSGRIDLHVRLIVDGVSRYDTVPGGYTGAMWIAVTPKSFPVLLYKGISLNQLRFFTYDTRLSLLETQLALQSDKLLWSPKGKPYDISDLHIWDRDGSLILTLDLDAPIIGYEGKKIEVLGKNSSGGTTSSRAKNKKIDEVVTVLDTSLIGHYKPNTFFRAIPKDGDSVVLKSGHFYILSTHEYVRVPPMLACEMVPMDERSGEFRSHYAGFIDPGWGYGKNGEGRGRPLTLEVRPFEDLVIRHGQPVGKIMFERLTDEPDMFYDDIGSNYLEQTGPKLAKFFKT